MGSPKEPIEYQSASKGRGSGWTVGMFVSLAMLVSVSGLSCLGGVLLLGKWSGWVLLGGSVILLLAGVHFAFGRKSYAPLAILLTAGCLFLLLLGVCGGSAFSGW